MSASGDGGGPPLGMDLVGSTLDTSAVSAFSGAPRGEPSARPWPSAIVGGDLQKARREWLHTNGAGAYASSTLAGMHTRRYHGLLVAALDPPRGRHVLLSHVDTTVVGPRSAAAAAGRARPGGRAPAWELAKHQFPGVDPKTTPFHLQRFDQDPLPRWTFAVADGELSVTLALLRGENALVLRYAFRGKTPLDLRLRPLIAARPFHTLQREHGGMLQRVELRPTEGAQSPGSQRPPPGEMRVQPKRDLPRICFRYEGTFVGSPDWWRRFEYLAERDRGLDYEEDLWTPGVFEMPLREGEPVWLVAAVDKLPEGAPDALLEATRSALLAEDPGPTAPLLERRLTIASEPYRADLARRPGVIAGYPWFEVWGRDALASLPGLYLVHGKHEGAVRVLRDLIGAMADGLVPHRLPEPENGAADSPPDYGSADATLWLFEAARHVADALGDHHAFVMDELFPALRGAFEAVVRGTQNGVHLTPDGLFAAGGEGDALTWMAARVGGAPVTPRAGCAVELSALWARGCDTLARFAGAAGDAALADRADAARDRARAALRDRFWCDETSYPYDVIAEADGGESTRDPSIRPNAVIALAVDPDAFSPERARLLLDRARRELLTPAGLRTLAPSDPRYVGRYQGDVKKRDAAYHQGAVRPFLLGFYARAALRAGVEDRASIARLVASAAASELALGHVPELCDGDAPHRPGGAYAQAWSVAELLRVLVWDLGRDAG